MTIEESVVAALRASSGVSALASTRIYPGERAEDATLPCVLYTLDGDRPIFTLAGRTSHIEGTLLLECVARRKSTAIGLRNAARDLLKDYVGRLGNPTTGAIVNVCTVDTEESDEYDAADGSADPVFVESVEFRITYRED